MENSKAHFATNAAVKLALDRVRARLDAAAPARNEGVGLEAWISAGKAGLWRFPEIGFILHPDFWGRGFAREALVLIMDRAFGVHGLPKVDADVDPRNAPSLKLLGGLGFRETGRKERTWLVGKEWCDSVYLELDASSWRLRR
jgi:RimJ/RimL family protein N-acetyltransferase